MTITVSEIDLYIAALFLLFLTPGSVWVAMLARGLKDGLAKQGYKTVSRVWALSPYLAVRRRTGSPHNAAPITFSGPNW